MVSSDREQRGGNISQVQTFTVPFALKEIKGNLNINTNAPTKPNAPSKHSQEQIINQAIQFHLKGNITEAKKYYQYCINQGFNDHRVFQIMG